MTYLVIFVFVAVAGIGALWIYQRRQRSHLGSVDGFRESLKKISARDIVVPDTDEDRPTYVRPNGRRLEPLDPARREAARRRLEARRAIRAS